MADYASEQGHWYDREGNPRYTYLNAKGEEKNTTLREARKLGLYPSVTTIISLASKPGLESWKQDQTILACLTMPKIEGETEQEYIKRLKEDAKEQAKKAAEKGTEIHGVLERGFREGLKPNEEGYKYFKSVISTIETEISEQFEDCLWCPERSFASSLGYGGKVDLHNDRCLIDFKGTDKPLESLKTWDEHAMQLSAYSAGLSRDWHQCGICYVHRETAESRLIWLKEADLIKGWECFQALLKFYYAKTGLER